MGSFLFATDKSVSASSCTEDCIMNGFSHVAIEKRNLITIVPVKFALQISTLLRYDLQLLTELIACCVIAYIPLRKTSLAKLY